MIINIKSLAVIIPVYNEGSSLYANINEIMRVFNKNGIRCRFMIVDDGSCDNTWDIVRSLSKEHDNICSIRFARNFGKEAALYAGICQIDSDLYLIMDSDLQHPPECVAEMLKMMDAEGSDIVDGIKKSRGRETFKTHFSAKIFYCLLKSFTGLDLDNSSDFKLISRRVVNALREFKESGMFFRGIVGWVGFKRSAYYFEVDERASGTSKFSFKKLARLALDAVLSYTSKPLYLTLFGGLGFLAISFLLAVQTLINYFSGNALSGFSTVILILLFSGSMIMISIGIIGVYISRIYNEVKRRPRYIVSERTGNSDGDY